MQNGVYNNRKGMIEGFMVDISFFLLILLFFMVANSRLQNVLCLSVCFSKGQFVCPHVLQFACPFAEFCNRFSEPHCLSFVTVCFLFFVTQTPRA